MLGADITATTGLNFHDDFGFSGAGGTVELNSSGGMVTVDSTIQVSSNDPIPDQTPPPPIRRSASGGNITVHSGLTTGDAISLTTNARLLSLLDAKAPGPGGTISVTTAGGNIQVGQDFANDAVLEADRGTITLQTFDNALSQITIDCASFIAETVNIISSGDATIGGLDPAPIDATTILLSAAHDLTWNGESSTKFAFDSPGNVTIEAGHDLAILNALTIFRMNGGQSEGLNLTLQAGNNLNFGDAIVLRSFGGGLSTGGNVAIVAGAGTAGGSITGVGSNKNITEATIIGSDLGTGGNVRLQADGSITADKVTLSVTLPQDTALTSSVGLTGPVLGTGGNIDIVTGSDFTLVAGASVGGSGLSAIVDTGTEGTISTGGVITLNVGGAYSVVGPSLFQVANSDGEIDSGGNISMTVANDLTANGGLEADVLSGSAGVIGTGGNIDFTVHGNVSTPHLNAGDSTFPGQLILYVDASNGGSISTGGNITLQIDGTTSLDGPLAMEVDTYAGGGIATGGNITGHFVGDVTNTTGNFHSLNFFVVNGGNSFFGPLDGGTIGTGGNIDITFDGNVNTHPSGAMGGFGAEIGNANGGSIGTGGNISVKIGTSSDPLSGNLNVSSLFVYTTNTNGGQIGAGGNITFDAKGAVTTINQAVFELLNNGGTISSDPVVYVHAASFNIGGVLLADIDNTNGSIGGAGGSLSLHSDGAITVGQGMWVLGTVTAGGDVTANKIASTDVTVTSATGSINALAGGIGRFRFLDGDNSMPDVLHTLTAFKITSLGGINFNGVAANGDVSPATNAGDLTLNVNSISFDPSGDIQGAVTFNGGDASSTFGPGDGGHFTVNAVNDITVSSDIEATTGAQDVNAAPSGNGGSVALHSDNGTVTLNNRIEVSSNDPYPDQTPPPPVRRSNTGGNITVTSGATDSRAINIASTAQLLSLLNSAATGAGGTILVSATGNGSSIDVDNSNGLIEADGGTIEINNHGNSSAINISNANMHAT